MGARTFDPPFITWQANSPSRPASSRSGEYLRSELAQEQGLNTGSGASSDTAAAAYSWTKKEPNPLPPAADIEGGQDQGLDETVDELIRGVLEETGLLDMLEKVPACPTS